MKTIKKLIVLSIMLLPMMMSSIYMTMGAATGLLFLVALVALFMMSPTASTGSLLFFLSRTKNKALIRRPYCYIPMVFFACVALMPLILRDKRAIFLAYREPNLSIFVAVVYIGFVLLIIGLIVNSPKMFVIGLMFATCSIPPYFAAMSLTEDFGYDFGRVMEFRDSWKWIIYELSNIFLCCTALFGKKRLYGITSIFAAFAFIGISLYYQSNVAAGYGNNYLSAGAWCLAIVITNIMLISFEQVDQLESDEKDLGETIGEVLIQFVLRHSKVIGSILIFLPVWQLIRGGNLLVNNRIELGVQLKRFIVFAFGIILLAKDINKKITWSILPKERDKTKSAEPVKTTEEQSGNATAKQKRTYVILCILAVLAVAAFFVVTKVIIPEQHRNAAYQEAAELYASGDYDAAYNRYLTVAGYKDVDKLLSTDKNLLAAAARETKLKSYKKIGGTVTFGSYEQDNNPTNGKEDIEWIVLDVQGEKSLLISKYALDAQAYNSTRTDITWEKCTLRAWLNSTFISTAFNADEKTAILTTSVDNSKSQGYSGYSTEGGNDTKDHIFLLSYAEAWKYFSSDSSRTCKPTAYAKAQGAYVNSNNGNCWWWLRSPGHYQSIAAYVYADGSRRSDIVNYCSYAVRPAFWINLESDIF